MLGRRMEMQSEAGERGHLMKTCCQPNQQFEIYNQEIETLKKLMSRRPTEPDRFFYDIHELQKTWILAWLLIC